MACEVPGKDNAVHNLLSSSKARHSPPSLEESTYYEPSLVHVSVVMQGGGEGPVPVPNLEEHKNLLYSPPLGQQKKTPF